MDGVMEGRAEGFAEADARGDGASAPVMLEDFLDYAARHGFDVSNGPLAAELFEHVGCKRLLRYMGFIEGRGVRGGARSVEGLSDLLAFDASMRNLVLKYTDKLEVQLKARYAQCMSEEHGERCLADKSNFRSPAEHRDVMWLAKAEMKRQKGEGAAGRKALRDFESVSIWCFLEACSLNTVSRLLDNTRSARVVNRVAGSFGANKRCLVSWMRTVGHVRNLCAHFMPFAICDRIPSEPKPVAGAEGDPTSPLYVLVVIERLLRGRAEGGHAEAKRDLARFRWDAALSVRQFECKRPELAAALRIPQGYTACRPSPPPPDRLAAIGERPVEYGVLSLVA